MKKLKFAFILNAIVLLCAINALAQNNDTIPPQPIICNYPSPISTDTGIYTVVEQMPEFPNGKVALLNYLRDNLRYPPIAQENGIEGKVYIRFVVDTTGELTQIEVKRGLQGGCSEEAVRLIRAMPQWIPGRNNGKRVKVFYILPVPFKLE